MNGMEVDVESMILRHLPLSDTNASILIQLAPSGEVGSATPASVHHSWK
jgi:hypothetical protein